MLLLLEEKDRALQEALAAELIATMLRCGKTCRASVESSSGAEWRGVERSGVKMGVW